MTTKTKKTTKATKTIKKRVNKRTIEVNPLDLLMICTGNPNEARVNTLERTLEENPKNKAAQEAKAKLLEFAKKHAEEEKKRRYFKEVILKYKFNLKGARVFLALHEIPSGNITEDDYLWYREHEAELVDELRIYVHEILHGIQNLETQKQAKKTLKDFKFRLFKSCIEQYTHKGGDTTKKVIFKDEITNQNEVIPDDGTVFTVDINSKQTDVIVFGKDYEKIVVAENAVDIIMPQRKLGNIE
jgi:hypothetical protein